MARFMDDIAASATRAWSWSAVLKGTFAALAVYVVLRYFGAALGVSTGDGVLEGGFAVWTVIAQMVSIAAGGLVTGFALGSHRLLDGALAGTFTWAVSVVLMTTLLGSPGAQAAVPALWGAFLGAVLSAATGVLGGTLGAQLSRKRPAVQPHLPGMPPDQGSGI